MPDCCGERARGVEHPRAAERGAERVDPQPSRQIGAVRRMDVEHVLRRVGDRRCRPRPRRASAAAGGTRRCRRGPSAPSPRTSPRSASSGVSSPAVVPAARVARGGEVTDVRLGRGERGRARSPSSSGVPVLALVRHRHRALQVAGRSGRSLPDRRPVRLDFTASEPTDVEQAGERRGIPPNASHGVLVAEVGERRLRVLGADRRRPGLRRR